jgi:hypothetical protein
MDSSFSRFASPLLTGLALTLVLAACSSDKTNTPSGTGGAAGAAGAAGTPVGAGGTPVTPPGNGGMATATGGMASAAGGMAAAAGGMAAAAGGAAGAGGAGGAAGGGGAAGSGYVCAERPSADPGATGAAGDMCCGGVGKCTDPKTLMGDAAKAYGHDTCSSALVCAPPTATTAPTSCTTHVGISAAAGLEGRCVPKCFLLGNPLALLLDDGGGTCTTGQSCAPCFSPVDGKSTGACNTGTDTPKNAAPAPYTACPEGGDGGTQPYMGGGLCVPGSVVDKLSDMTSPLYNPAIPGLKQDNCAMGEKCVPALKAANPGYCSEKCTTSMTLASIGYKNGACTPLYVIFDTNGMPGIQIANGAGASTCMNANELCAPCGNPLTGGTPSGACY